jgi:transcriptional regulator with XRE-family HTH domain
MTGMKFAEKLAMLIDRTGVKSAEIARALKIKPPNVSRMLSDEQKPSLAQGLIIARALGVTVDYLADDAQDEPASGLTPDEQNFLSLYRMVRDGKLTEFGDLIRDLSESSRYAGNPSFAPPNPPLIEDQTPPGEAPATGAKRTA